ncbi:hypothetical protein QBC33DRAFT_513492 [Phialemonium atrogriseum]|uniref:Life-span regulatory factor-domain-containing protein n=1 Tax=Phialemonium atrogriseum TaxID=1093897 RepID=A0AAJ0C345_9PEZI|nr:uncharacterized protein QBC33DRAFT_513492 [Phialemonium atrogriseum]KAK1769269.1 hypothetical protein QBC33DRAFT_513492 [Phialemonium atrogriseum]
MTDVRKVVTVSDLSSKHKSSRPAPMTRKTTPQGGQKLGKSPRDREKEWEEDRFFDDERESFPQFCMTCEKQFVPHDERFLYCSEACRAHDRNNTSATTAFPSRYAGQYTANYPLYSGSHLEPKDIIPRASPSRPSSTHFSPPTTPNSSNHTTAISALRSLSIRPPSPPSPTGSYHTSIWPFNRSPAASPSTSYSKVAPRVFSSTYDPGYYGVAGAVSYGMTSSSIDRPLPSRRPGAHSRPKSIELVTPMVGR